MVEVVAFAHALADAGEDGVAAMVRRHVVDELLDGHGLAHAGAAEEADLAALDERDDEIDGLDAGLEDLRLRRLLIEGGRLAMDRQALGACRHVALAVDGLAEHVEDAAERCLSHRNGDRRARGRGRLAAREAGRVAHGDGADAVEAEVRGDFEHDALVRAGLLDAQRFADGRAALREVDVHDRGR